MYTSSQASSELARYGRASSHQGETDLTCAWAFRLSVRRPAKNHRPGWEPQDLQSTGHLVGAEGCLRSNLPPGEESEIKTRVSYTVIPDRLIFRVIVPFVMLGS